MRILVVSNLYPPLSPGIGEWRCQVTVEMLQLRGHEVTVLTSNFGVTNEERGGAIERRLHLNAVFGQREVSEFSALRELESHNHRVLRETIAEFRPDLIYVWSLRGLSKSLLFALGRSGVPFATDVSDDWMITELRRDPWLRWWNSENLPLAARMKRGALELAGQRKQIDVTAPTRPRDGIERMPRVFDGDATAAGSLDVFQFRRISFCSAFLRQAACNAGCAVGQGEVISPGIATEAFFSEPRESALPTRRFLICTPLVRDSGIITAFNALKVVCERGARVTLTVCGKGPSDQVASMRSFVIEHRLPVEFVNLAPRSRELYQLFRDSDVFLRTEEWDEPCVTTPLEAMASGQAVIATSAGAGAELLRHGVNALVFGAGDFATLAELMLALIGDPALRHRLASAGQTEVVARYNEVAVGDQVENFLKETVAVWK